MSKLKIRHDKAMAKLKQELFRETPIYILGLTDEFVMNPKVENGRESLGGYMYRFMAQSGMWFTLYVEHYEGKDFIVEIGYTIDVDTPYFARHKVPFEQVAATVKELVLMVRQF